MVFVHGYKNLTFFQLWVDHAIFGGSISFKDKYFAYFFGNPTIRLNQAAFVAGQICLGGYFVILETKISDLSADINHGKWLADQRSAGLNPTPEESLANHKLCKRKSIEDDTVLLNGLQKSSAIAAKESNKMWEDIRKSFPKEEDD